MCIRDSLYWVGGTLLGGLLGSVIPFSTEGLDFALTALFVVLFLGQLENAGSPVSYTHLLMSAVAFCGSMQFAAITLLTSAFDPVAALLLSIMVNARHLFYGISMLGKYKRCV